MLLSLSSHLPEIASNLLVNETVGDPIIRGVPLRTSKWYEAPLPNIHSDNFWEFFLGKKGVKIVRQ